MKIEIINPIDYPGWDDLLLTNDQSTFFHTTAWARVLSESYKYKSLYFTIIENGKLCTLIPVMEINSFLTGKRGVSLPFTDECAPIAEDEKQLMKMIQSVVEYGQIAKWKHIEYRGDHQGLNNTPLYTSHHKHTLELNKDAEKIFLTFRDSTKRNIKRARKEKVGVSIKNDWDSMQAFYRLNCMTRKLHGLPPQPRSFFMRLFEFVISQRKGLVVLASIDGKIIAAAICFHYSDKAIYKYGASDKLYQKLRANNLVMWEAIKWYANNQYKEFSFGRTEPDNQGLLQFKRGWGTKEEKLYYYKYDMKKEAFVSEEAGPKSSFYFFKHMPSPLLRLTGNILYRHVG